MLTMYTKIYRRGIVFILVVLFLFLTFWRLDDPHLMWDEGWTLTVARNWVELGHYGRLLNGNLHSAGLAGHFPNISSVALSFRLLGIGVWQGRLPGILYLFGSLALIYFLASRLFGREIAIGSLVISMLMLGHVQLHPIFMGRGITGDVQMVFFLLSGYTLLYLAVNRAYWLIIPAAFMWGIALLTKSQTMPFWLISMIIPLVIALLKHQWRIALLFAIGLSSAWISRWLLLNLQGFTLSGKTVPGVSVVGLYDITAFVLSASIRKMAFTIALTYGLPALLGMCFVGWKYLRDLFDTNKPTELNIVGLSLLSLAGSWYAWFILLGVFWPRYLFPALFISSIFVSPLLYDLTTKFNAPATIKRASDVLKFKKFNRYTLGALLAVVLIAMTVPLTGIVFFQHIMNYSGSSTQEVADYLNHRTPEDAVIETYESELHFLLDRNYHYPLDQLAVELIKRGYYPDEEVLIDYDPLIADPDFLVVGTFCNLWRCYEDVLATSEFKLSKDFGDYQIYERVR